MAFLNMYKRISLPSVAKSQSSCILFTIALVVGSQLRPLLQTHRHSTLLLKGQCIEIRTQEHAPVILSCSHHKIVSPSGNSSSYDMGKSI